MNCLICYSPASHELWVQNGYAIRRCDKCGFAFVAPTPTPAQLARYYDQSYAVPLERYARNSARNEGRIADLERWQPQRGRLLEVGASYGHSLALARERGWRVAGVELSPTASGYAREQFGLDVASCDLLDASFEEGSFDAAIMWHVLEHTHDPRAQLARLRVLLRPGGVLGLRVPNVASFGARLAGRSWPWVSPPAHLWYFSPETLPRLLRACGYEIVEVQTLRGDGNNFYQHMLIAAGARLNALRRGLRRAPAPGFPSAANAEPSAIRPPAASAPTGLVHAWLRMLGQAQPLTDGLARLTRPLVEPLERGGLGDELLVYARKPFDS